MWRPVWITPDAHLSWVAMQQPATLACHLFSWPCCTQSGEGATVSHHFTTSAQFLFDTFACSRCSEPPDSWLNSDFSEIF